jgi:hypothetical protein
VTITLRDDYYSKNPLTRIALAESFRHAATQARARNVTETHLLDKSGALQVKLSWS